MELWIRSQNKERLLKLNDIFANANYCIADGKTYGYHMFANGEFFLGTYETKERCIEILDEIQKFISEGGIVEFRENQIVGRMESYKKTVYEMPEE